LMSDIGIRHELVQIKYIDAFRKNTINGTNTDFYVPDSWDKYLGDRDGDLEINTDDVEVWEYTNTKTRSQLTVSSLDEYGHVTVSTAPASGSNSTHHI